MHLFRLLKILRVSVRFGLDEFFLGHERVRGLRRITSGVFFWRKLDRPRGERLRLALEALGPIFVKFGQVLSTRRDLIPLDIADELAKLQDQVPPFAPGLVMATLARAYGKPADQGSSVSIRWRSPAPRWRRYTLPCCGAGARPQ